MAAAHLPRLGIGSGRWRVSNVLTRQRRTAVPFGFPSDPSRGIVPIGTSTFPEILGYLTGF
jgi:hypothetical protein